MTEPGSRVLRLDCCAGAGAVPGRAAGRAGRRRAQVLRRLLRDLRPRERGGDRPGAASEPRAPDLLPGAERAVDGAHGRRVRADAEPARGPRVHDVDRPRRDEHGDRRGARDGQPAAGAAAARRRLRDASGGPGAAAARGAVAGRRVGERRVRAGLALLRPRLAGRAADPGRACRDAGAHLARRDGGRHARAAAGRADRGVRLARGVSRRARLARAARRARRRRACACRRGDPRREAAADRRGRRGDLQRGDRRARALRRRDRHPGRRDAGRPGLADATATRSSRARSAPPGRSRRTGSPQRPTW